MRGYGRLRLAGHDVLAHRLAWCVERGSIPNGLHVLHHCDNRACINVDHLFLGTNDDNVADKVAKGRQARGDLICAKTRGENHYRSLIDASTARAIRAATGSLNQIAAAFSTTKSVVQGVRSGKNWRNA